MIRFTLVIPSLTSGGAERVMATLADFWAARGDSVTLLTFDDGQVEPFYPLNAAIAHWPLGIAKPSVGALPAVKNNLRRIRLLRRAIVASRPDVVISFLDTTNVTTLIATRGLGVPVIVEEHTDPAQKTLGRGWLRLRRLFYPRADRVVVLSNIAKSYFPASIQNKAAVVANPIVVDSPGESIAREPGLTLIAMGRLGPEKGFDLLLDAFALIAARFPDWRLVIWGEGELRPALEAQRARLGLESRVSLPGRTTTPHDEFRRADLFVMSSRREGFPMALGEAMACGLPAVSTDCPSGPRQLIRDRVDGLLTPMDDPVALASALERLMADDEFRSSLAARAPDVLQRFGLELVMAQWDDLIAAARRDRHHRRFRRFRTFGSPPSETAIESNAYDAR